MIRSEILQEKDKTQARLSEECASVHDYLLPYHSNSTLAFFSEAGERFS
jgi:hypothetical protein